MFFSLFYSFTDSKHWAFYCILFFGFQANSQNCGENIDLNTWTQEGPVGNGNWIVNSSGTQVEQFINGQSTLFVSPQDFINVRIHGTLRVDQFAGDDDFIGFVMGYKTPNSTSSPDDCEFILFDWKKAAQFDLGFFGNEGYSLTKIDTTINMSSQFASWALLYPKNDLPPGFDVLDTRYGSMEGWQHGANYNFILTYTNSKILIEINGDTIFNVEGCFPKGRFGFYNMSQSNAQYSNFSYEIIGDYQTEDVCYGDPTTFISIDSTCFYSVMDQQITSWNWAFGDGTSSTLSNPIHTYNSPGVYQTQLIIQDGLGCTDTAYKQVFVRYPNAQLPALIKPCEGEPFSLSSTHGGPIFSWNTGCITQTCEVNSNGTYIVSITDTYGCSASDTSAVAFVSVPVVLIDENPHPCGGTLLNVETQNTEKIVWDDGSTGNFITVYQAGYHVLNAKNGDCMVMDSIYLDSIDGTTDEKMPNVFSPNNDGINDFFSPQFAGYGATDVKLVIFNRWGNLIRELDTPKWDGKNKNLKQVNTGVYFWVLEYLDVCNGKGLIVQKGAVQVEL